MIWFTYALFNDRCSHTDYHSPLHTPQTLALQNLLLARLSACTLDGHLPDEFQTCAMALCSTECGCFTVKPQICHLSTLHPSHKWQDPLFSWLSSSPLHVLYFFLYLFVCQRVLGGFLMLVNNSVRHGGAYITLRYQLHSRYVFSQWRYWWCQFCFKSVLRIPMVFSIVVLPISVLTKSSLPSTSSPTLPPHPESMLAVLLFLGRHHTPLPTYTWTHTHHIGNQ